MADKVTVFADDDYIRNVILTNGRLLQEFPILLSFRDSMHRFDKECTTCTGKAAALEKMSELFNTIRQTLANFPVDYKNRFKKLLGVDKVRVPYYVVEEKKRRIFHGTM